MVPFPWCRGAIWVTRSLNFKVTIFFNVKYYKIEPYLHWQTDRKSYVIFIFANLEWPLTQISNANLFLKFDRWLKLWLVNFNFSILREVSFGHFSDTCVSLFKYDCTIRAARKRSLYYYQSLKGPICWRVVTFDYLICWLVLVEFFAEPDLTVHDYSLSYSMLKLQHVKQVKHLELTSCHILF